MPNNETPDESYFLEIFGVPSKFRFIVQVHKQAAARRPSPIARLPQTLWNLGCAGLVLLALPLLCCVLMLQLRPRSL